MQQVGHGLLPRSFATPTSINVPSGTQASQANTMLSGYIDVASVVLPCLAWRPVLMSAGLHSRIACGIHAHCSWQSHRTAGDTSAAQGEPTAAKTTGERTLQPPNGRQHQQYAQGRPFKGMDAGLKWVTACGGFAEPGIVCDLGNNARIVCHSFVSTRRRPALARHTAALERTPVSTAVCASVVRYLQGP